MTEAYAKSKAVGVQIGSILVAISKGYSIYSQRHGDQNTDSIRKARSTGAPSPDPEEATCR
jgi:hypothetical protein